MHPATFFVFGLLVLVASVSSEHEKMIPKMQTAGTVKELEKESLELTDCPVLCYCTPFVCHCCNYGQVCCPGGNTCCPDNHSYCCPNGPYCCPPESNVCCVDTGLCCTDSYPQCCPETCCADDETCCGENCCRDEQKCCESDDSDEKYCCGKNGDCCGDKCCSEGFQCCSEFNSEEQEMETVCEEKPASNHMGANPEIVNTEDIFLTPELLKAGINPQFQLMALAVGQGDCTMMVCPNNDIVIVDMGSTSPTSLTASAINAQLKTYFALQTASKMRIVVTHPNTDHYNYFQGGLDGLQDKVEYFILSGQYTRYKGFKTWLEANFNKNQINLINQGNTCFGNDQCTITPQGQASPVIDPQTLCGNDPKVTFTILGANIGTTMNSQSVVIKVKYYSQLSTIILPGDFETQDAQDELVNHYKGTTELQGVFYKIAHHGASYLANYPNYVAAIQPQVAFVSQAYPSTRNAHPRCDAIKVILEEGKILPVHYASNSPFACGVASYTPHVYEKWCHAIYATCREPSKCYNIVFTFYPVGTYSVKYIGPVTVDKDKQGEVQQEDKHTEL